MKVRVSNSPAVSIRNAPKVGEVYRNTKGSLMVCTHVADGSVRFMRVDQATKEIDQIVSYYISYIVRSKWHRVGYARIPEMEIILS